MSLAGSRNSPVSQKAMVLRQAIWNQVPRRVLASWLSQRRRRRPRQMQRRRPGQKAKKRPASADMESGGIRVAPSDAAPPPERHTRAPRGNRRRLDFAEPPEPDAWLGCGTCRGGLRGCTGCRKKRGMVVRDGRWVWPLPLECLQEVEMESPCHLGGGGSGVPAGS